MNRYFARDGRVFVQTLGEAPRQVSSALTPQGRELERFERAAKTAQQQREAMLGGHPLNRLFGPGEVTVTKNPDGSMTHRMTR